MIVAWTTVAKPEDADRLAEGAVATGLAACAQVEGPVISHFVWQGKQERATEYRICFKCLSANSSALGEWVQRHHPYQTPEWFAVAAEHVGEKYLSWAEANSKSRPFPTSKQP
jgi:periplasmic divalent cation tolerance protein